MLSKPSAPQAQRYRRVSLGLTLFLPFSSLQFCSPTDPLSATVNRFSCIIFQRWLTYCSPLHPPESLEKSRRHAVNTALRQTADKSLEK